MFRIIAKNSLEQKSFKRASTQLPNTRIHFAYRMNYIRFGMHFYFTVFKLPTAFINHSLNLITVSFSAQIPHREKVHTQFIQFVRTSQTATLKRVEMSPSWRTNFTKHGSAWTPLHLSLHCISSFARSFSR